MDPNPAQMSPRAFYAVAVGRAPGVYATWAECQEVVRGVRNARFKKFATEEEASSFVRAHGEAAPPELAPEPESAPAPDGALVCFTDGACSANGYANARAAYAVVWPDAREHDVAARLPGPAQTNNRAEYAAALAALRVAARRDPTFARPLLIYSDSRLLIDSVTKWAPGWKRRGWRKSDGSAVANADLLSELDAAIAQRTGGVRWAHVAAHTGRGDYASLWNDVADRAAVAALAGAAPEAAADSRAQE